jgi:hypothetical protein
MIPFIFERMGPREDLPNRTRLTAHLAGMHPLIGLGSPVVTAYRDLRIDKPEESYERRPLNPETGVPDAHSHLFGSSIPI